MPTPRNHRMPTPWSEQEQRRALQYAMRQRVWGLPMSTHPHSAARGLVALVLAIIVLWLRAC